MQHLENDMEDLFKRAGENYSPQKGKGDWESIARQLADKAGSPTIVEPVRNNRNKKIISFFLILIIVSLGLFIMKNPTTEKPSLANQNELIKREKNTPDNTETKINNRGMNKNDGATDILVAKTRGNKYGIKTVSPSGNTSSEETTVFNPASDFISNKESPSKEKKENRLVIEKIEKKENYFFSMEDLRGSLNNRLPESLAYNAENLQQRKSGDIVLKQDDNSSLIKKKKKETPVISQKNKGLYFGLIAASDFSKVQSPTFHNTGFDAGLLAGFRVNTRLSFETGVIWNKKSYRSEGKNFSMDKVGSAMPAGMIINDLESRSSLIEIPIKVKYDFFRKRNSDFFIAVGVSSYIMTTEKNKYNVTMNGNHEKVSGVYEKNNYGIPAVANFSLGYEHSVSGTVNIRIEPFLKIPLQGMGVGSLPVTSAGLQVGITNRLK